MHRAPPKAARCARRRIEGQRPSASQLGAEDYCVGRSAASTHASAGATHPLRWPVAAVAMAFWLAQVVTGAGPAAAAAQAGKDTPPVPARAAAALPGTPMPRPAAGMADEAEHMAALDRAIAPARATEISVENALRIRDAVGAIGAANVAKGLDLRGQITDPLGQKIVDWFRLRSGYGEPAEFRAFLEQNPAWPDRTLIQQRLEEALFTQGGTSTAIKAQLDKTPPRTGAGLAALASAHLAEGDKAKARQLAARAWREDMVPASLEQGFLERFGAVLAPADHKWRLDKLLMDDSRWTGERNERAAFIRRLIPLLDAPEQAKARARLAVFLRAKDATRLMDALPADAKEDWGLVLSRVQMLRRANRDDEAAKLLLGAPTDAEKIVSPDDWWEERRANAYAALEAGKPRLAYDLVRQAGPLTVNPLKEQSFMSGWLALRQLKDAAAAETHFGAMRKAADGPLSRAKADYWLARTAEARGDSDRAAEYHRLAARETDTFHGQLSRQRLEPGQKPLPLLQPDRPTDEQIARFNGLDATKAAVMARKAGLNSSVTRAFIYGLRGVMEREAEVAMVAHLAEALGDTQTAVRIAKSAVARGQKLHTYAYPVHPFPAYTALRAPPEAALLLGIARQESEFNTLTVSGAGARGLLQVMPITAKHVCRDYKITCDIPRLLTDMAYNTALASAYIADRMDEFQGSYVLAIAGYNAGPGRARQWIRQFGDPRDPKVDVIDWIERIPFQETREYVAKVLSNVQVYRARLGDAKTALRLEADLARARGAARAAEAPATKAGASVSGASVSGADAGEPPIPPATSSNN